MKSKNIIEWIGDGTVRKFYDVSSNRFAAFDKTNNEFRLFETPSTALRAELRLKEIKEFIEFAEFVYDPTMKSKLFLDDTGIQCLNIYEPPSFAKDIYYTGKNVEPMESLPTKVEAFLRHMCSGDEKCYEFLIRWIAGSLDFKPQTCLIVFSTERAVGKTLLATYISLLHGRNNSAKTKDNVFKNRFNSAFKDKTFVFVDEIALTGGKTGEQEMNNIKDMMNPFIEIEAKSVNAKLCRNFASMMIASNNLNAIPHIGKDDRQFSVLETPDIKLADKFLEFSNDDAIKKELLSDDVIAESFRFFKSLKRPAERLGPYRGRKIQELIESSQSDWKATLLKDIYPFVVDGNYKENIGGFGCNQGPALYELSIPQIQTLFKEYGVSRPPGRTRFEELCKEHSDMFKFTHKSSGVRAIKFLRAKE